MSLLLLSNLFILKTKNVWEILFGLFLLEEKQKRG